MEVQPVKPSPIFRKGGIFLKCYADDTALPIIFSGCLHCLLDEEKMQQELKSII